MIMSPWDLGRAALIAPKVKTVTEHRPPFGAERNYLKAASLGSWGRQPTRIAGSAGMIVPLLRWTSV